MPKGVKKNKLKDIIKEVENDCEFIKHYYVYDCNDEEIFNGTITELMNSDLLDKYVNDHEIVDETDKISYINIYLDED